MRPRVKGFSPSKGKLAEASVRLFYGLRQLDERGGNAIVPEPLSAVGVWLLWIA